MTEQEKLSPGSIWLLSTQKSAPNPDAKLKTLPVATILLYKYCHQDEARFEELCNFFEECFEAGRQYQERTNARG